MDGHVRDPVCELLHATDLHPPPVHPLAAQDSPRSTPILDDLHKRGTLLHSCPRHSIPADWNSTPAQSCTSPSAILILVGLA